MLAETFAALAEPTRLRIVDLLRTRPRPVGELCERLPMAQPQVSKHLRVLREAGLVHVEAQGQLRVYELRAKPLRDLDRWLARYRGIWDARFDQLDELLVEIEDVEARGAARERTKER